jgi:hypothetical protein
VSQPEHMKPDHQESETPTQIQQHEWCFVAGTTTVA